MVLHLIGLGLNDELDITIRGLEIVRRCRRLYLEAYTAVLLTDTDKLEALYGQKLVIADRDMVESHADDILCGADTDDVGFLVVGDPFGATTHTDLQLRARALGIPVQVTHNASILNAAGACGLQLYRYGETVSIVFFTDTWRPDSFYHKIVANQQLGLHTLCLLDIQVKEPTLESLARGRKVYRPPRFMSVGEAVAQLLELEERLQLGACSPDRVAVGLARVGAPSQQLIAGRLADLQHVDFGPPLHSLVVPGHLHEMEQSMLAALTTQTTTGSA